MNDGISLIKVTEFPYFLFSQWLEMAGIENGSVTQIALNVTTAIYRNTDFYSLN